MRSKRAAATEFDPSDLPSGEDFDAVQAYLDRLVPSRVVFRRNEPYRVVEVQPETPAIVLLDGNRRPLEKSSQVPPGAKLEPRVYAGESLSIADFRRRLNDDLIPYRGDVDAEILHKVVGFKGFNRSDAAAAGGSLADVQHGVSGGRSLYWMRSPDGKLWGPITAAGDVDRGHAQSLRRSPWRATVE